MSARLAAAIAVACGVVIAVAVAAVASSEDAAEPSYRGSEPPALFHLVAFALRDERGRLVRSRDLRGKAVVLTFLDSQCEDTCPVLAGLVADGLERLPRESRAAVAAVAISTDPAGDTPASRRAFLSRHGASGKIRYVSGPIAALAPVWKRFQILSSHESGDDELHSAPVRIYDPAGVWVSTLHAGADLTPANLAHDVRVALAEGRRSR